MIIFVENFDDIAKKMFSKFKKFENVFSLKKSKILTRRKENVDYVIKLKNNKQSFYESIYNLFNFKLKTFRLYLNDALKKHIIKHLINLIETSILFVLKKNEQLQLYVDYRDLNKIIQKIDIRYLITQMLNQLKNYQFSSRSI